MKLTTETKIIGAIVLATIAIIVGGVFMFSRKSNLPKEKIVAENGLHWHPKLTIYIKGQKQQLDRDIGLGGVEMSMHTHKEDYKNGVVHMEMNGTVSKDQTKLGRFFQIWGKEFNSKCIFDRCNNSEGKVKMTVNGKVNTDFNDFLMKDGDNIEIRYE